MNKLTDSEIRKKVENLKSFYSQGFIHAFANAFALLVWMLLSHTSAYWPIWIHFASAAIMLIEACRMKMLPKPSSDLLPFLRKEWEDETFKQIKKQITTEEKVLDSNKSNTKTPSSSKTSSENSTKKITNTKIKPKNSKK